LPPKTSPAKVAGAERAIRPAELRTFRAQQREDMREIMETWDTRRRNFEEKSAEFEERFVYYMEEHKRILRESLKLRNEHRAKKEERLAKQKGLLQSLPTNPFVHAFYQHSMFNDETVEGGGELSAALAESLTRQASSAFIFSSEVWTHLDSILFHGQREIFLTIRKKLPYITREQIIQNMLRLRSNMTREEIDGFALYVFPDNPMTKEWCAIDVTRHFKSQLLMPHRRDVILGLYYSFFLQQPQGSWTHKSVPPPLTRFSLLETLKGFDTGSVNYTVMKSFLAEHFGLIEKQASAQKCSFYAAFVQHMSTRTPMAELFFGFVLHFLNECLCLESLKKLEKESQNVQDGV